MATRWPVGGIRTFLHYVYTQPSFGDCRVKLLVPGQDPATDLAGYLPAPVFQVVATPSSALGLGRAVRRELKQDRYDLLHSHGLTAGMLGQFARIGRRVPHLITIHDMFLPKMFRGIRGGLTRSMLNRAVSSVDGVHAVGEDCAANFLEFVSSVPRRRVHAIPNGIDTERFVRAQPLDVRRECQLAPDTALIGFFGRFMAPKGFRTLVDAIGRLTERGFSRPLKVVTFGWGGFIREDYRYLEDKGLCDHFLQRPHTDEPERWMKGMDIIAMPSHWEACGLLAMEALTAGVPIVGTECIGLRRVLAGSPAHVVRPGDAAALAEALRCELADARTAEFSAYAAIAAERFTVTRNATALRALYDDILAGFA